jgi:hypothetical protein
VLVVDGILVTSCTNLSELYAAKIGINLNGIFFLLEDGLNVHALKCCLVAVEYGTYNVHFLFD